MLLIQAFSNKVPWNAQNFLELFHLFLKLWSNQLLFKIIISNKNKTYFFFLIKH